MEKTAKIIKEIKEEKKELVQEKKEIINENKMLKHKLAEKALSSAKKFKKEFNIAIKTAFLAAFGFLIALAWNDLITEYVNTISQSAPVQGKFISALVVTLICVIGIVIISTIVGEE